MSDSELAEALRGAIEIAEKRGTQRDALRAENALLKTQHAEAYFNFGGWRSIKMRLKAENAALKAELERLRKTVTVHCSYCGVLLGNEEAWNVVVPEHMAHCEKNPAVLLAQENAALKATIERLTDLVRYERHHLLDAQLISEEEYAALVADSESGQRVARLEGYDAMRRTIELLTAPVSDEDVDRLSFVLGMLHDDSAPSSREDVRVAMNNLIANRVKETECK